MAGYIDWLGARLEATAPLLRASGSILLHLDPRASHRARVLLADGFGADRYEAILALFPDALSGRASQKAGTLSGGEQKMLASASALYSDAPLLVMDEPTEGLQPSNVDLLGLHVGSARSTGRGVILIEQHIALAERLADRFIVIEKGEVVEAGYANDPELHIRIAKRLMI